jgi:hypothetical protein
MGVASGMPALVVTVRKRRSKKVTAAARLWRGRSLELAQCCEGLGGVLGRAVEGLEADEVGGDDAGPDAEDHDRSYR